MQSRGTYPFFHILLILLCGLPGRKVHNSASSLFFFFVDYKIWPSGWDLMIHLYHKIQEEFVRLILSDRFWVVHMPFVRTVIIIIIIIIFFVNF